MANWHDLLMTGKSFLQQVHRLVSSREVKRSLLFVLFRVFAVASLVCFFALFSLALALSVLIALSTCLSLESLRKRNPKNVTLVSAAQEIDAQF